MFNLQGSEIVIVLLLALVVLGPEKLPDAMRKMGQAYAELKKMSSGFQNEFRSAIDEPMREVRDTANVLRDSADFTKLQAGERDEKPKSAEMAAGDPDAVPTDDVPTFETPAGDQDGPELTADSRPAPFETDSSTAPRPERTVFPGPTAGTGMSAPEEAGDVDDDSGDESATVVADESDPEPEPAPSAAGDDAAMPGDASIEGATESPATDPDANDDADPEIDDETSTER